MSEPSSENIEVRPAETHDLNDLDEFIKPFVDQKVLIPRTFDELTELIRDGFVAEDQARLVGFAALEIYSSKLGEIRSLAVLPDYQGMGLGKLLVQACIERARERNVLEVMAITSSESFFKSCGFDFTLPGREKSALHSDSRFVILPENTFTERVIDSCYQRSWDRCNFR